MKTPNLPTVSANAYYFTDKLKEKLNRIWQYPVTIVEAPMGYGKTVAVREFLRDKEVDTIWVSIANELEGDLWTHLCQSCIRQQPQFRSLAEQALELGFPCRPAAAEIIFQRLRRAQLKRPVVVILDDYHLAASQEMNQFIALTAHAGLSDFHILLITRDSYQGNAEYLQLKGLLHMVKKEAFIFTRQDIKEYCSLIGIPLSDGETDELFCRTQGWISAVYLYLQQYEKERSFVFRSSIYELVEREIYRPLSEEIKEFLFFAYPFGDFTYEQSEFVWGKANCYEIIQTLQIKNAFLSYDEGRQVYTLHYALRQFMEILFSRQNFTKRRDAYIRCAGWFDRQKEYYRAMELYDRAGCYEQLLVMMEADKGRSITFERRRFFARVLDDCPRALKQRHYYAVFIFAVYSFLCNDYKRFEESLGLFEAAIEATQNIKKRMQMKGLLECLYSFREFNDIAKMGRHYEKAYQYFGKAVEIFDIYRNLWTMGSPSVMLLFHQKNGCLQEEVGLMKEYLPRYFTLTNGHGMGGAFLMEAESCFFAGEFEKAIIKAYAAEMAARKYNQQGNVCCAIFLQMRIAVAQGDDEVLQRLFVAIKHFSDQDQSKDRVLVYMNQMLEDCIFITAGIAIDKKNSLDIDYEFGLEEQHYLFARPIYCLICGALMLRKKKYVNLLGGFSALMREAEFQKFMLFKIYVHIYQAAAFYQIGQELEAVVELKEAFNLALKDRIYMPFAELYPYIQELVEMMSEATGYGEDISIIIRLAKEYEAGAAKITKSHQQKEKPLLTKREKEIARLVYAGKTNSEIAQELYIAKSTVKRALVVIYKKLGIKCRTEIKLHIDSL